MVAGTWRGAYSILCLVAIVVIVTSGSAIVIADVTASNNTETETNESILGHSINYTLVDAEPIVDTAGFDIDPQIAELETVEGVNLTLPDERIQVENASVPQYTVELETGYRFEPEPGLEAAILEPEAVIDEFTPTYEVDGIDLAEESADSRDFETNLELNESINDRDLTMDDSRYEVDFEYEDEDDDAFTLNDTEYILDPALGVSDIEFNITDTVLETDFQFDDVVIDDEYDTDTINEKLKAEFDTVRVVVQFEDGFDESYIETLRNLGYTLTDDISETTHYAVVPRERVDELAELSFVRSVSSIDPEAKLAPGLDRTLGEQSVIVRAFEEIAVGDLNIREVESDRTGQPQDPTDDELDIMGVDRDIYEFQNAADEHVYIGTLDGSEIDQLIGSSRVKWIEPWELPTVDLDTSDRVSGVEYTDHLMHSDNWDGSDVMVGVLDSGIDIDHPHFDDETVVLSKDWTYDLSPSSGYSGEDNDGHGTHVAGIITGESHDGDHRGVAPEADLTVSRVLDDPDKVREGLMNPWTFFTDDAMWVGPIAKPTRIFDEVADDAAAVEDEHVDIMSNSWGFDYGKYDYVMTAPVDGWANENPYTLVTTSNGNAEDSSTWPAAGKNVLAVGGISGDHTLSHLNEIDPVEAGQVKPDVNAPSDNIRAPGLDDDYVSKSGTSMATPYVSGLAARYMSYQKDQRDIDKVRANEVKTALIASTTGQLNPEKYNGVGWGATNDHKLYHLARTPYNQFSSVVYDNEVNVHSFEVPEDAGTVEVTLSWSEKANKLTTSFLRNDLHLFVTKQDPDEAIEIDESLLGSDDVEISVEDPLLSDVDEDRTVRRVEIPAEEREAGEWNILVHAEDTTWNNDHKLYDVAIAMQGDEQFQVDADSFNVGSDSETNVRLDLDAGHDGDWSTGMIPQIAPGVAVESLDVDGGNMCGWELKYANEVIDSGASGDDRFSVGTVSGTTDSITSKYIDVCVKPDRSTGDSVTLEYELSYVSYPEDRTSTPSGWSDMGNRETISGSVSGSVVGAISNLRSTTHDEDSWSNDPAIEFDWDLQEPREHAILVTRNQQSEMDELEWENVNMGARSGNRFQSYEPDPGLIDDGEYYLHVQLKTEELEETVTDVHTIGPFGIDTGSPGAVQGLEAVEASIPADTIDRDRIERDSFDVIDEGSQVESRLEFQGEQLLWPEVVDDDSVTFSWNETATDWGESDSSHYEYALTSHQTPPLRDGGGLIESALPDEYNQKMYLDIKSTDVGERSISVDDLDAGIYVFHIIPHDLAGNEGDHDYQIICVTGGGSMHECTEGDGPEYDLFGVVDVEFDIPKHEFDPLSDDLTVLTDSIGEDPGLAECRDQGHRPICDPPPAELYQDIDYEDIAVYIDGEPRLHIEFHGGEIQRYAIVDDFSDIDVTTEMQIDVQTMTDIVYADDRASSMNQAYLDGDLDVEYIGFRWDVEIEEEFKTGLSL